MPGAEHRMMALLAAVAGAMVGVVGEIPDPVG
jgi:hypothetical protein